MNVSVDWITSIEVKEKGSNDWEEYDLEKLYVKGA